MNNYAYFATQLGVTRTYVKLLFDGKRNPNTDKAMEIISAAANEYAEECKAKFISDILRKWKLKNILERKRCNICTNRFAGTENVS